MVLDSIPLHINAPQLLKMLHMDETSADAPTVHTLIREAEAIGRPKALYRVVYLDGKGDDHVVYLDGKGDDHVVAEGARLSSRVLRVNLDAANRVFAYVATCGTELERWAEARDDILEKYWADGIMLMAVRTAVTFLSHHLQEVYRPGPLSRMNPGSLPDWPLREQRPLFALLGDVQGAIGVQLTESCLMIPRKSVSGIQFPTQESFESCQLCGREVCPGRRAPYDPALYERRYHMAATAATPSGAGMHDDLHDDL
jgi:hypothetical protein